MNRVVLLTGASSGLGKVLAQRLLEKDYIVIGTYNNNEINLCTENYKCNLEKSLEIDNLFEKIKAKYHKIDVLINCAALSLDSDINNKTKEEFERVLNVNVIAPFLLIKKFSTIMENGTVINISSSDASDTYNEYAIDYAASKAALNNITKNLANILSNVKICAVEPLWMDTESVLEMDQEFLEKELKRNGQEKLQSKEEVASEIVKLIDSGNFLNGQIIKLEEI